MSSGHGHTRRQAYGKRMKDLRARRLDELEVDLEGPRGWNRGGAWESDAPLGRLSFDPARDNTSARAR
jgi:hypothetical protein